MKNFFINPNRTFIIAEIGVNHNNNISLVKKLERDIKKNQIVKHNLFF